MSANKNLYWRCDGCGAEAVTLYGAPDYYLPDGWVARGGIGIELQYLCEECVAK